MKKLSILILQLFLTVLPGFIFAQEVYVGNAKFVLPVVEKWIAEYKKENPESQIRIQTNQTGHKNLNSLSIIANQSSETGNDKIVYLGKYALIPVSNTNNPLLSKAGKGLKKKDLTKLLFEQSIDDEDLFEEERKEKFTATVYSRKGDAATSITLAEAFGASTDRIRGKGIIGDELYLLNAVQKDESGITFNTLNYVYNLHSRKLKPELSILPLNIGSKHRKAIESQNMDQVITLLEETEIDEIPVGKFGLRIPGNLVKNTEVQKFVKWLFTHSPEFNHQFGFLNLEEEELDKQKALLRTDYITYVQQK